jgi:hypothetical protein
MLKKMSSKETRNPIFHGDVNDGGRLVSTADLLFDDSRTFRRMAGQPPTHLPAAMRRIVTGTVSVLP